MFQEIYHFGSRYSLFAEKSLRKYSNLFAGYIELCSPSEATPDMKRVTGKFLAVFYSANELFLKKTNVLDAPNFLHAKEDFLNDLKEILQIPIHEQESTSKLSYFLELFDDLFKEMELESTWFGGDMPSLEAYKRNREVTIVVHPFVELYRLLFFPNVDKTTIEEYISLTAKIIYYDNDLRSKNDKLHEKPNLISLVMSEEKTDEVTTKQKLLRERDFFIEEFNKYEISLQTNLHPFIRFLLTCIEGNQQVMNLHGDRYEPL